MRTLLMVLMIAGLMSTVGVYAAGFGTTPSTKTLSGSGAETVSAANTSTTSISWRFSGELVDAAKVTWTPVAAGDYDVIVSAGGQSGTLNVPSSGTAERVDDVVVLASTVAASAVTSATIVIEEN